MTISDASGAPPRSTVKRVAKVCCGIVAAGLLVVAVLTQREQFLAAVQRLSWFSVLLATAAALLASGANLMSWRGAMSGVGIRLQLPLSCRVFFISQLGKYVPGSVWPIIAQIELTKGQGIPRVRSTTGALVAMVVGVATSGIISVLVLLTTASDSRSKYWYVFVVVPCVLVMLAPPALERALRLVGKVTRRELGTTRLSWFGLGTAVSWSFVMWGLFGLHTWFVVRDLLPDSEPSYLLMVGAFAFAWLAGFLVVIAPAGVGIREAVFVLALGGTLSVPDALALAILSRFILTIVDAILGGGALLLTPGFVGRLRERSRDRSVG